MVPVTWTKIDDFFRLKAVIKKFQGIYGNNSVTLVCQGETKPLSFLHEGAGHR